MKTKVVTIRLILGPGVAGTHFLDSSKVWMTHPRLDIAVLGSLASIGPRPPASASSMFVLVGSSSGAPSGDSPAHREELTSFPRFWVAYSLHTEYQPLSPPSTAAGVNLVSKTFWKWDGPDRCYIHPIH